MLARFVVLVVALTACGGSSGSPGSGSDAAVKHDAPVDIGMYDFGCGGNTACTVDKVCCAMPGATTTFSCVAQASCPSGDKISCDGPDECSGSTPVCCGVDVGDGTGSYPSCGISALGTSCTSAAACPTHLASDCSDTSKVQLCHVSSECTDPNNPKCCTFTSNGASLTFCIDQTTANLGGATCN